MFRLPEVSTLSTLSTSCLFFDLTCEELLVIPNPSGDWMRLGKKHGIIFPIPISRRFRPWPSSSQPWDWTKRFKRDFFRSAISPQWWPGGLRFFWSPTQSWRLVWSFSTSWNSRILSELLYRRIHDMMSHMLLKISGKTSTNWQDIPLIWWFLVPDSTVGCSCHSASMATLKARPDLLAYTDGLYLLGADWSIGQCLGCSRPAFAHLALPWLTVRGEWWSPLLLA